MNIVRWMRAKFLGRRYAVEISVIRNLAIIGVYCGKLPPVKAEEHLKRVAEVINKDEIKAALKVSHIFFTSVFE